MSAPHVEQPRTAPTAERDRAAVSVLACASALVPADAREPLVDRLVRRGAWDTLAWLTNGAGPYGRLSPAARYAGRTITAPKWGARELDRISEWEGAGIRLLTRADEHWPATIEDLGHLAPVALWVRGTIPRLYDGAVCIVGSRNLSSGGHSKIDRIVAGLPVPVISGLARGADETAHRAALRHRVLTVAVLPSGVDHPYPADNRQLAERIIEDGGAVISEFPPGTSAGRQRFLDRNRIIAALGSGSLIVEAGAVSGTLSEARHAYRLGRVLTAVPGTPGADKLIADGMAFPMLGSADLDALHHSGVVSS